MMREEKDIIISQIRLGEPLFFKRDFPNPGYYCILYKGSAIACVSKDKYRVMFNKENAKAYGWEILVTPIPFKDKDDQGRIQHTGSRLSDFNELALIELLSND